MNCTECDGAGSIEVDCEKCMGEGTVRDDGGMVIRCPDCNGDGTISEDCSDCDGEGHKECESCGGTGEI
jgi:DnaJ-class molecular chaperone